LNGDRERQKETEKEGEGERQGGGFSLSAWKFHESFFLAGYKSQVPPDNSGPGLRKGIRTDIKSWMSI
jgi:hypothetical protein